MNAPTSFPLADEPSSTPDIVIRDERFNRGSTPRRWWAGDAFGTAWHNALSATFPRGEAFFIESVKAHRDGADPKLAERNPRLRATGNQPYSRTCRLQPLGRG